LLKLEFHKQQPCWKSPAWSYSNNWFLPFCFW